jgi:hypothetical protein
MRMGAWVSSFDGWLGEKNQAEEEMPAEFQITSTLGLIL